MSHLIYRAAWADAGYVAPTVEEQFGADVPDRTTLTLPLVEAGLGSNMTTGGHAGGHAGEQADLFDATLSFCAEPRTRNEIREHLGLQSRRYVLEEVIRPLLGSGRLALTIPDKPRSPNQRYVKVD